MSLPDPESEIVNHELTLGRLNQWEHAFIAANTHGTSQTPHLRFEQGRGVVKINEATCSLCEAWGLNDGNWHPVPTTHN